MARPKRTSRTLEKAEIRAAGLQAIPTEFEFGSGLTLNGYLTQIQDLRSKLTAYNTILSQVDKTYSDLKDAEKLLDDLSDRMLTGIATQFGKNSQEYTMAGGVRKSERKPRAKKTTTDSSN